MIHWTPDTGVRLLQALAGALAPRGVQLGLNAVDYTFDASSWPPEATQAFGATLVTLEAREVLCPARSFGALRNKAVCTMLLEPSCLQMLIVMLSAAALASGLLLGGARRSAAAVLVGGAARPEPELH